LGPIIGGSLSKPAERFPSWFGESEFHKKYPYFLACAVPATFSVVAWIVTFLFLKETLPAPTPISNYFKIKKTGAISLHGQEGSSSSTVTLGTPPTPSAKKPLGLRSLLTPRVIVAAANYASLSLVDIAYRAIQPLFLSTPVELGGLGLPPSTIGNLLSIFGILNGVFQVFFFARLHDYFGSKKVFIAGIASALPVFAAFPLMNFLAQTQGYSLLLWGVVGSQIVISILLSLSYGMS